MSSPAAFAAPAGTVAARLTPRRADILLRVVLAAAAVFACYLFEWRFLRFATSEAVRLVWASLAGTAPRVAFDTIEIGGERFYYGVGCAFADVFCASIPLLWSVGRSLRQNAARLAGFAAVLFVANVVRALATHVVCTAGIPLLAPDLAFGALLYLAVWRWIVRERGWRGTVGNA